MSITAITIQNFRSIAHFKQNMKAINIFVGKNDRGKSNVLRALDLFFNGEKRHGYELDWTRDYCAFARKRQRKAEQISITIEITPPEYFKNAKPIVWEKIWRKEGLHAESLAYSDRQEISARSKLKPFLRSMRYDYVPAIKGEDYFKGLMANLHDMLEATVETKIRSASQNFTETIAENTQPILEGILKQLELKSTIALPTSLRDLFAQLEFMSESGSKPFSLLQRGDGVKVRHIPIILQWLAEQANARSNQGRPKAVTIWGYEEPENNLELCRCLELAEQFVENATTIQTFVTTHSPAFYSVYRNSNSDHVRLFLTKKGEHTPTTTITPITDNDLASLDSSMGLMELLQPHFQKLIEEQKQVEENKKNLHDTNKPTIFCEGPSDRALIEATVMEYFPNLTDKLIVKCSDSKGGGHEWVKDMIIAWSYSRKAVKAVGLFDADKGASDSRTKLSAKVKDSGREYVSWCKLQPTEVLKKCFAENIIVPYAIEELLSPKVWEYAENKGWLEERSNLSQLYYFSRTDVSFTEYINNLLKDEHHRRLALKKVGSSSKTKKSFSQYVLGLSEEERKEALAGLKPTIEKCLAKLDLSLEG